MEMLAVIGLGKMGGNLAHQALGKGYKVVGYTIGKPPAELVAAGLQTIDNLKDLLHALSPPRLVFLYVPAGPAVDALIDQLATILEAGDIVADGGNSYWGDSIRRHSRLSQHGIALLDLGTSGGPAGARDGACFMVGGDIEPVTQVTPLLKALAVDGGFVHAGPPGAGHFVKLVHNGIEFGMLQAIGEGVALLERYGASLPLADILQCWNHGSVIRSWLIELMERNYRAENGLSSIPSYVEDTGEVNWLVDDALHMDVPTPVITQAVIQLIASRDTQKNSSRAVATMRHGFGGHPYGHDAGIQKERREGRVGSFIAPTW